MRTLRLVVVVGILGGASASRAQDGGPPDAMSKEGASQGDGAPDGAPEDDDAHADELDRYQRLQYGPEQNALPVAPRSEEVPLRGGLEIAAGVRPGGGPPVLGVALGIDRFVGPRLALGGRLGYLAAGAGEDHASFASFDGGVRLRYGLAPWRESDRRQLELETGLGGRLGSAGAHADAWLGVNASLGLLRLGVRYSRALLGDSEATDLVLGVVEWVTPAVYHYDPSHVDRRERRGPRIGLGTHLVIGGYAPGALGAQAPGLALELAIYLGGTFVLAPRWDLSWYPAADGGAAAVDTVLVDLWWSPSLDGRLGFLGGLGWAADHRDAGGPRAGGPVADLGVWYEVSQPGLHLGLQLRAGLTDEGDDLRAAFVTLGGRQIFR